MWVKLLNNMVASESIETLQLKQYSKSEHFNNNYRNCQRPVPRKNHQHNHHQGYNDFDDPNDSEYSSNYHQRPIHPKNH